MANKANIQDLNLSGQLQLQENEFIIDDFTNNEFINKYGHTYGNKLSPIHRLKGTTSSLYHVTGYQDGATISQNNNFIQTPIGQISLNNFLSDGQINCSDTVLCYIPGSYSLTNRFAVRLLACSGSTLTFYMGWLSTTVPSTSSLTVSKASTTVSTGLSVILKGVSVGQINSSNYGFLILGINSSGDYVLQLYSYIWNSTSVSISVGKVGETTLSLTSIEDPVIVTYCAELGYKILVSVYSNKTNPEVETLVLMPVNDEMTAIPVLFANDGTSTTRSTSTVNTVNIKDLLTASSSDTVTYGKASYGLTKYQVDVNQNNENYSKITNLKWYYYFNTTPAKTETNTVSTLLSTDLSSYTATSWPSETEYIINARNESGDIKFKASLAGTNNYSDELVSDTLYELPNVNGSNDTKSAIVYLQTNEPIWQTILAVTDQTFNGFSYYVGVLVLEITTEEGVYKYKVVPHLNAAISEWEFYEMSGYVSVEPTISYTTTTTYETTPLVNFTGILSNGRCINTRTPQCTSGTVFDAQFYSFEGTYSDSSTWTIDDNYSLVTIPTTLNDESTILLTVPEDYNSPYSLVTQTFNVIDPYSFRTTLVYNSANKEEDEENYTDFNMTYDSNFGQIFLNSGFDTTYNYVGGSKYNQTTKTNHFSILYNYNEVSGISMNNILLTDWFSVSDILAWYGDFILYKDSNNNYKYLMLGTWETSYSKDNIDLFYQIINDRYFVTRSSSYYNAYDIETNKLIHWADDYNNRIMTGVSISGDYISDIDYDDYTLIDSYEIASGVNPTFEITSVPYSSLLLSPDIYSNVYADNFTVYDTRQQVEIFQAISETTPTYEVSYLNGLFFKNNMLLDTDWVSGTYLSVNALAEYVNTYNNNDMVINNGVAYPLMKYNGNNVYTYQLTNGLTNAEDVFVLQSLYYMVSKGNIYEINMQSGEIESYQAIVNVNGMTYIGFTPQFALFWSPMNKSFYAFTGAATMNKLFQADKISEITGTSYCTSTQEIFIGTDIGLVCVDENGWWMDDNLLNVFRLTYYDDKFYAYGYAYNNGTLERADYLYNYNDYVNPEATDSDNTLRFTTTWLGSKENLKRRIDCVYIRLEKGVDSAFDTSTLETETSSSSYTPDKFTITTTTMTDIGLEADTVSRDIAESDWDEKTNSLYIRFQPKYQKCVAMKFDVETTCPVISIAVGYIDLDEKAAISTVNI